MEATMLMGGALGTRVLRGTTMAPLAWRLHNSLRWGYIWGWLCNEAAKVFTKITGIPTMIAELRAVLVRDGHRIDYGVVSRRVVTNNGVGFIVDAWQNSVELEIMKYHGVGTGTAAEAASDSALGTETTTQINPDSTRATGSLTEGATANIWKTVGTVTFDGTVAITEHGIFSQAATGGGVLLDRSKFDAINVVNGDSIEFTYQLTLTAGG
jgi:hypothetical protein